MNLFKKLFGKKMPGVREFLKEGAVIIDVRTREEYARGHIDGSTNIPLDALPAHWGELKKMNCPLITVCQSGMRSGRAKSFLESRGMRVINGGGWQALNQKKIE